MINLQKIIFSIFTLFHVSTMDCHGQTQHYPDDLHTHLNGSYSQNFLHKTAKKNNQMCAYEKFITLHEAMKTCIAQQKFKAVIPLIWEKFACIHSIVQSLEDIKDGTLSLIQEHPSRYIEIRTTPKIIGDSTLNDYVQSFVDGLTIANTQERSKVSKGILSIDRTKHTHEQALEIIQLAIHYHEKGDPIVGIDLSGNPDTHTRSLYGESLQHVLKSVLESPLGLAIHCAEADHDLEKSDFDTVLNTLQDWKNQHPENLHDKEFFFGKVRLGHVIYPTSHQIKIIQELNLPIELCPTCHILLGWWTPGQKHPIQDIYPNMDAPLALGTDDTIIFDTDIRTEEQHLNSIFGQNSDFNNLSKKLRFT